MHHHDSSHGGISPQASVGPSTRRERTLADLAAKRAEMLCGILGLDRRALTEIDPFGETGWSVKDLLAYVAAWDRWEHRQMERILEGGHPRGVDVDACSAIVVAQCRDRSLEVVFELQDARSSWVTRLRNLPEDVFFESRPFEDGDWTFSNCVRVPWEHDAD